MINKEQIVNYLVDHIQKTESEKGEIALFSWSHALRCKIDNEYNISGDDNRILAIEAYNRTHPHSLYTINPLTLDNPNKTYKIL